jgi:pimeloyl-ACP methyl ester carboxylesterase
VTESVEAFRRDVKEAAGPDGTVETIVHAGDPREPATLHAVFASRGRAATRPTILFLHGKGGSGTEWRRDAARALGLGWNILVPELRGHPPSTGSRITYGWFEKVDLGLLVAEAERRYGIDPARLGVDGCSMGALVALHFAATELSPAALWLQSPFGDMRRMAVHYAHRATLLPAWLLDLPVRLAVSRIETKSGLPLSSVDPVAAARRVTCPTTVVHGEKDALVPIDFALPVFEALAGEKTFWRVPRCGHCHHADEPQAVLGAEYVRRWTAFFDRHLSSPK